MGETFTAADAYAFTILNWAGMLAIDLTPYPNIRAFMARVAARPTGAGGDARRRAFARSCRLKRSTEATGRRPVAFTSSGIW